MTPTTPILHPGDGLCTCPPPTFQGAGEEDGESRPDSLSLLPLSESLLSCTPAFIPITATHTHPHSHSCWHTCTALRRCTSSPTYTQWYIHTRAQHVCTLDTQLLVHMLSCIENTLEEALSQRSPDHLGVHTHGICSLTLGDGEKAMPPKLSHPGQSRLWRERRVQGQCPPGALWHSWPD